MPLELLRLQSYPEAVPKAVIGMSVFKISDIFFLFPSPACASSVLTHKEGKELPHSRHKIHIHLSCLFMIVTLYLNRPTSFASQKPINAIATICSFDIDATSSCTLTSRQKLCVKPKGRLCAQCTCEQSEPAASPLCGEALSSERSCSYRCCEATRQ